MPTARAWLLLSTIVTIAPQVSGGPPQAGGVSCTPSGSLIRLPAIPEASGLAASSRVPGRFWIHNDSGMPILFAVSNTGIVLGSVTIANARVNDWEAIAVGSCPSGSCIYIGDIGDNSRERKTITIYRVPEPDGVLPSSITAEIFPAVYPDRAHDAETLVFAGGRLLIVTKGEREAVAIYGFPPVLTSDRPMTLEKIGDARPGGRPADADKISDGTATPDLKWIVLRSTTALIFYRAADLMTGRWNEIGRVDLRQVGEPQGEGVAVGADSAIYLIGEGGKNKSQPGTMARLTCSWPD